MKEDTEIQYNQIAEKLIKRYEREEGNSWKDNPMSLCQWMGSQAGNWSNATWRLYKSAMIFYMQNHGPAETVKFLQGTLWKKKLKGDNKKTSQKKARRLSISDLTQLLDKLQSSKGKYDAFIAKWLLSGLLVGIRPCEWHEAKIEDNALVLRNAKFNKDRSCGEFRRIHFQADKIEDLQTVIEFVQELSMMKLSKKEFIKLYEFCRRRLYSVNKMLWGERELNICFYTTRHQFSANAKSTLDLISVAALMGHRSTDTATRNYLTKRYGDENMIMVYPNHENLMQVEDKFKMFANNQEKGEKTSRKN